MHALPHVAVRPASCSPVPARRRAGRLLLPSGPRARRRSAGPGRRGLAARPAPEVVAGSTRPRPGGGPGTAASTWPAGSASRCAPPWPGGSASPARLAGRGVVVVDHGADPDHLRAGRGLGRASATRSPPARSLGRLELFGSHCFPRACLHWGLVEGRRRLPRPAHPRRRAVPVRLLPLRRRLAGAVPGGRALPSARAARAAAAVRSPGALGRAVRPLVGRVPAARCAASAAAAQARGCAWR